MIELIFLFFVMIVQVIIPPIPAELIVIGAGKLHGVWVTTLVAGAGLFAGSVIVYFFGAWIQKYFHNLFAKKKVARVIERLHEVETLMLLVRVLPYNPSDIISYAAGIIKVNIKKYLIITFFVTFIRCFLLAYFGTQISNIETLLVVFSLLFVSALIGWAVVFGIASKKKGADK